VLSCDAADDAIVCVQQLEAATCCAARGMLVILYVFENYENDKSIGLEIFRDLYFVTDCTRYVRDPLPVDP
jgi:hypothetical protein